MENKKQKCEKLIRKWKDLKEKSFKTTSYKSGRKIKKYNNIIIKEMKEYRWVIENIRDDCLDFLSPSDKHEIYEGTERADKEK